MEKTDELKIISTLVIGFDVVPAIIPICDISVLSLIIEVLLHTHNVKRVCGQDICHRLRLGIVRP